MSVPYTFSTRLTSLSKLLRAFDEAGQAPASQEPSEEFKLCAAGEISLEEYLGRRIEVSLVRLIPHLDEEDRNYVREACFEFLRDDFVHTGMFRCISSRLRTSPHSGHTREEGALVNQKENAAKKSDTSLGSEDLQALKRGDITVDEYLERRLERQIEVLNLDRMLTDEERDKLRAIIRDNFLKSPLFRHYTDAMTDGLKSKT